MKCSATFWFIYVALHCHAALTRLQQVDELNGERALKFVIIVAMKNHAVESCKHCIGESQCGTYNACTFWISLELASVRIEWSKCSSTRERERKTRMRTEMRARERERVIEKMSENQRLPEWDRMRMYDWKSTRNAVSRWNAFAYAKQCYHR